MLNLAMQADYMQLIFYGHTADVLTPDKQRAVKLQIDVGNSAPKVMS